MREQCIYAMLRTIKGLSRAFYQFDIDWVHTPPARSVAAAAAGNLSQSHQPLRTAVRGRISPNAFIRRIAFQGLMPVADKATRRPLMGFFFRMVAKNVGVAVTRQNDHTWQQVLGTMRPDTMVVIMPEGRMMRAQRPWIKKAAR